MHLYISVSCFVCAVSLTHSLRLCKPHLARHKCIISRRLHWMQLKLESFSGETTCLHATECARGCDVIACAAGNKRIGTESVRRETDRPVMRKIARFRSLAGQSVHLCIKYIQIENCCCFFVIVNKSTLLPYFGSNKFSFKLMTSL